MLLFILSIISGTTPRGSQPEDDLVIRFQRGDARAYDELVGLWYNRVVNFAFRMLGNLDDAHDVTQEVFLRLHGALSRFRRDAAFSTFLYRIIVRVCANEIKQRTRRIPVIDPPENELTEGETAETCLLRTERERAVQQAIQEIPEHFRLPYLLFEIAGYSEKEIAGILGVPVGTVKSRLSRARRHFSEKILHWRELFLDAE